MISNQVLQETINGIKGITEVDLCVMDLSGRPVVQTMEAIGDVEKEVRSFSESMAESQVIDGVQYFKIFDDKRLEYILLIQGQNENDYTI